MSLLASLGTAVPFEEVEPPLLAGPFRVLDRLFTGGRVIKAFRLGADAAQPSGGAVSTRIPPSS